MAQQTNPQVKPRVFIGSSSAGLGIAYKIQEHLGTETDAVVWKDEQWLNKFTLERLLEILPRYDYAVMVFRPDDTVEMKGKELKATRDNVVFELGLFMGKHGRDKTFIIFQDDSNSRTPSDLLGINFALYADGQTSSLGAACYKIKERILEDWAKVQTTAPKIQEVDSSSEPDPVFYEAGMLYRVLNAVSSPYYSINSALLDPLNIAKEVNSLADIRSVRKIARELFNYYMHPFLKSRHTPPQKLRVYYAYYLGDGAPIKDGQGNDVAPQHCRGKDENNNPINGEFIIGVSNPTESPEQNWMSGLPLQGYETQFGNKSYSNTAEAFKTRYSKYIPDTNDPKHNLGYFNFKVEEERTVYSVPVLYSHKAWNDRDWQAAIGVLTVSGSHAGMIKPEIRSRAEDLALLLGLIFYEHTKAHPDVTEVDKEIGYKEPLPIGFNRELKDHKDFPAFVRRVVSLRREIASHFEQYFIERGVHQFSQGELSFLKPLS
jgi:hypothetical protein